MNCIKIKIDMNKKIISIFVVGVIIIGVLIFILNNFYHPSGQSAKIQVAASFYPLYFFSKEIAGDKAEIINITPAGTEPHDYEPTTKDIIQIEKSRMLVINGFGFEPWSENIKQNIDPEKTLIIQAAQGLENQQKDPHTWLSPALAEQMVDKITQGFIRVDPASKDFYETNADNLKNRLANLDNEYKKGLANCKEKNIITSHAAFGYLAQAYGFNQISIAGLSPDEEPSPRQLADITKLAEADNIKYIFFEKLVSPKLSETIAGEIGAETLVLDPLEGLSLDDIAQGKDYFTEMKNNLNNLKIALQCP
jgi:zinc transport system substrate-binding protein